MTFVPDQDLEARGRSLYRTIMFWLLMLMLVGLLWQTASKSRRSGRTITYSEFVNEVNRNNVASVRLVESQSTADVDGTFRQPAQSFHTTVPKQALPDLTERLQKQGVSVEVAEQKEASWLRLVMTLAPALLIIALWTYIVRRQRNQPAPSAGAPPSTGPIGGRRQ